ncbi:TPA: WG repeat-containing protein [Candidatus Poribacteria bacterium]|nr:WG repeat-containing protein [Candidatus Poribacteria bacterium]
MPLIYDYVWSFHEGLCRFLKDDKWGFIDKTGRVVIPLIYDYVEPFHEGLCRFLKDGKYGFIDKTGRSPF